MREGGSPARQPNHSVTLRIFLRGAAEALRLRLASDPNIELVDRIEQAEAVLSLPPAALEDAAIMETLTTREHEVLALVADGLANRDIAARLGISDHTVKFHLASIFGKLGVSTRTEAVQRGLRLGVIDI
jgi:ATP/maltotriose-dependent transcriptional regulator MalT